MMQNESGDFEWHHMLTHNENKLDNLVIQDHNELHDLSRIPDTGNQLPVAEQFRRVLSKIQNHKA